jgi:hypothetical protein
VKTRKNLVKSVSEPRYEPGKSKIRSKCANQLSSRFADEICLPSLLLSVNVAMKIYLIMIITITIGALFCTLVELCTLTEERMVEKV